MKWENKSANKKLISLFLKNLINKVNNSEEGKCVVLIVGKMCLCARQVYILYDHLRAY